MAELTPGLPSLLRRLQACDLCHARKVKCDRQPQCLGCTDARVQCIRSRPKSTRRAKVSRRQASEEHVSRNGTNGSRIRSSRNSPARGINNDTHSLHRGKSLPLPEQTPHSNASPANVPSAGPSPEYSYQTDEVTNVIRRELDSNSSLATERRRVLESALSLTNHFNSAVHPVENFSFDQLLPGGVTPDDNIPAELFYMMLDDPPRVSGSWRVHWPDHITKDRFEEMCLALLNGNVTGQTASQYKVCVFSRTVTYVNRWLRICSSHELSKALERSKTQYTASALQYLRQLDLLSKPSLLMLQSLLSGAHLLQLLGDASQAWVLTGFASRVLVALGYHNLTHSQITQSEHSSEIRRSVFWCYYFDKILSMLFVRPPSLPELSASPAGLVEANPTEPLELKVKILIKLSQVQDGALSLLIKGNKMDEGQIAAVFPALERQLEGIWRDICESRHKPSETLELRFEWDSVDFTYHSVFTTVLRLNSTSLHNHWARERCLSHAREALVTMSSMQYHIFQDGRVCLDFLSWTILLYPLTPFFIVFCNVIATSNNQDWGLLTQITTTLSQIKDYNPLISSLHGLFSQFTGLCAQLHGLPVHDSPRPASRVPDLVNQGNSNREMDSSSQAMPAYHPGPESGQMAWSDGTSGGAQMGAAGLDSVGYEGVDQHVPPMWEDGLMWELFNIQPSIEWFGVGLK